MTVRTTAALRRMALGAALLAGVAACEGLTAPPPNFEWETTTQEWPPGALVDSLRLNPEISVEDGHIVVRGIVEIGSICDAVSVKAVTSGQVVDVAVRIYRRSPGCLAIGSTWYFEAREPHRRGQYRLRLHGDEKYTCCPGSRRASLDTIVTVN